MSQLKGITIIQPLPIHPGWIAGLGVLDLPYFQKSIQIFIWEKKKTLDFKMLDLNLKYLNIAVWTNKICLGTRFSPWMCQLELNLSSSNRKQTNK